MKVVSLKLPDEIRVRADSLNKKTGISKASLLRQCIIAGLPLVEKNTFTIQEAAASDDSVQCPSAA